jgi:hypothetical protein
LKRKKTKLIDTSNLLSRKPRGTALFNVCKNHYQNVLGQFEEHHYDLPFYIKNSFEGFLKCGDPREGFLRAHCQNCNSSKLVSFSCKKRGICPSCAGRVMNQTAAHLIDSVIPKGKVRQWVLSFPFQIRYLISYDKKTLNHLLGIFIRVVRKHYFDMAKKYGHKNPKFGALTFIQRFGGSCNLNVHFHTLFMDGYFYQDKFHGWEFRNVRDITDDEVAELNKKILARMIRSLKRRGVIEDFEEGNSQFNPPDFNPGLQSSYKNSINRKIGFGINSGGRLKKIGQKYNISWTPPIGRRMNYLNGFSLHANVCVGAKKRDSLEHLIRYVARPALCYDRIEQDNFGDIIFRLKTPYDDGTTHLKFSSEEFVEKIISIIPPPRLNLIRYHGVFAPNFKDRKKIVPRQKITNQKSDSDGEVIPDKKSYWIKWADLLKRVFKEDALKCHKCGKQMSIVAHICDMYSINKILKSAEFYNDEEIENITYQINDLRGPPEENFNY